MNTLLTTSQSLMIAIGRATRAGFAVGFVSPDEWERSYMDEAEYCKRHDQLVSVWQELADLGWQNFICDGADIVVRWAAPD